MAKMTIGKGLDEYLARLGNLEMKATDAIGLAIYEGAKIVADRIRSEIESLPVSSGHTRKGERRDPTQVEIDGMLEGLGVAKKQNEGGYINVKIGMDGYNANKTAKYPNGKPNAMIAWSIESGTTFVKKNSFITRAVKATRAQAEQAMKQKIDEEIAKIVDK